MIKCVFSDGSTHDVRSGFLEAASPVFAAMMQAGMVEANEKRIEFLQENKADVMEMLGFLDPCRGWRATINSGNVEKLLPLFDLYHIEPLYKESCEVLAMCPATPARVALARRCGVKEAMAAFIKKEARKIEEGIIAEDDYDTEFKAAVLDEVLEMKRKEAVVAAESDRAAKRRLTEFMTAVSDYVPQTPEWQKYKRMKQRLQDTFDEVLETFG